MGQGQFRKGAGTGRLLTPPERRIHPAGRRTALGLPDESGVPIGMAVARGNQGRDIYADDRDRKLWLGTLGEACEKTGWRIHAWVMMNNH